VADIYCEGAVHAFVVVQGVTSAQEMTTTLRPAGNAGSPQKAGKITSAIQQNFLYLGTCQEMPEPQLSWQYEPAMDDNGGRLAERDSGFAGTKAAITLNLTRWTEKVLRILKSPPFYTADGLVDGLTGPGARGSLTFLQGNFYSLWLVNDFWLSQQVGAPGDLNPGLYFPVCKSLGYSQPRGGSAPAMRMLEVGVIDTPVPVIGVGKTQIPGITAALIAAQGAGFAVPVGSFACWSQDESLFPRDAFNLLLY